MSPYSLDLRNEVISYIKSGKTQVSASSVFLLNLSTVNRWHLRYRREGNCLARKRLGARSKVNQEALVEYITPNSDLTPKDLSRELGVSAWSIYYWLKKLGYSYKKSVYLCGSK